MNKFHGIGLVILLAVTFAMVQSASGSTVYTNDVGGGLGFEGINLLPISTIDSRDSLFGETFYESSTKTMHMVWVDKKTIPAPDDIVFYSSTTDGITKTTPIVIYTGGGAPEFPKVIETEVFASGNNVFVSWLIEETAGVFSILEKTSTDGGATFSVVWTVFANATGVDQTEMEMVGNSLNDIIVTYRNSTSDTLEARVSHDNGVTWAFETIAGDLHGTGNADGFHNFGDHSLSMIGNEINFAFTATYTGSPCNTGCSTPFFQQSVDAGDTWLANPLRLTAGITDVSTNEPFIFSLLSAPASINILYFDHLSGTGQFEQARSTNGGTSFTTEINTGLQSDNCTGIIPYIDWIAIGAGSNLAIFCNDTIVVQIDFITSTNTGSSWSTVDSVFTQPATADNFQGYTNGTFGVITFHDVNDLTKDVIFSADSFATWYGARDTFTDDELGTIVPDGQIGITDDRVILPFDDQGGTNEVQLYSFVFPICLTDQDFNCPHDISKKVQLFGNFEPSPNRYGATATDNGYFTIYEVDVDVFDFRVTFASTTDAVTSTTPLDISGAMLTTNGANDDELYIIENSGTIDTFWIESATPTSQLFHARSTNGGTSFGAKTSVVINATFMQPVVSGNNIDIAFVQKAIPNLAPKFIQSTDGGTSWGSVIDIEGTGDCDDARQKIKLTKSASGNFYSAWMGKNQTSATQAICFNSSTNGGTTWSTTEFILDDSTTQQENDMEFEVFSNGANVTVIWENNNDDQFLQARSTDSGASFGAKEVALSTFNGSPCTDPSITGSVVQTGSNIIIACTGTQGIHIKRSTDMGAIYSGFIEILDSTPFSVIDVQGFASGTMVFFTAGESGSAGSDGDNRFAFSTDSGATFDATKTMFMKNIGSFEVKNGGAVVGTDTNVFLSFFHTTGFDGVNEQYVSLGTFGIVPDTTPPVITISGDNPISHLINTIYTDAGASCVDAVDGSLTLDSTVSTVDTSTVGSYTVTYTCTDLSANETIEVRTVNVVVEITTTTTTGGGAGAPVSGTVDTGIEGLTPEQILAFDQAVADAIASIEPSEGNIIETIIQTFFEFTVVDKVHDELRLQSFLDDERLGFRWSTGDDIIIVSATPALSPFMFTFEQFPVVRVGSGAFVSTNFILYNLEVPRTECGATITMNCVEKIRYEIPVTVNAIINGTQVSDTGTITVDLTEDAIDPILLIILSTLAIPIIGVIIQRSRGRSSVQAVRRIVS